MGRISGVVKNSLAGIAAQLSIKTLSFGFSVLVVRHLGAEQFGQYVAVLAFVRPPLALPLADWCLLP